MRRISSRSPRPRGWRRALGGLVTVAVVALLISTYPQAAAQAQAQATPSAQTVSPGARVMTPELVAKLRSVTSAVMSPSGTHVAYTLLVQRKPFVDEDGPAWRELHVLELATGESRPFVTGKVNVSDVSWTPDGSALAYLAKREGDEGRSLYAIPLAGGESVRLLEHGDGISDYSLSSDGMQVAFLSREKRDPRVKELAEKGFKAEIFEEGLRYSRLWIASLDGGEPRPVDVEGHVSSVLWSPAGDRLVLTVAPTPLVDDSYMKRRIRVVDPSSGQVTARIENPGKLGQIAWSPAGQRLAFISGEDINDPLQGRLIVVPATGGEQVDLVPDYEGHIAGVIWRDERTLIYLADEDLYTRIGEVAVDGSARRTVVEPPGPVLHGMSASRDGEVLSFTGDTPEHPNEVFVLHGDGGRPERMTESNPWLADVRLAPQETVVWQARDGLELHGLLIRPLDEVGGRRYPLVVQVHGGPESRYDDGWLTSYSLSGQVAASRGIAVFYPNYRASTGRGVEFSKLDHGDMGGKEFDDIVDGVDHLIDTGLADRDRVGVTGGSYGGYATGWLTTRYSDRFAAGVMFVGISNQISKVGTSDIPEEMFLVHNRLRPWDDWELFLERSPVYWAGDSNTPLLIMAGKDDPRVHPGQSMEMYRNLKLRGSAPVRLIFYPGEGHGNARAAARYDYNLRALRWLEHYLLGPGGDKPPTELDYPLERGDEGTPEKVTRSSDERG
ncbi:MAG: S9 family peptidase [Gemmatimonadales bacterium]